MKRKPRKTENLMNKNGDDEIADEEFEDEMDEEHEYEACELSDDDHLDPTFAFRSQNFSNKRLKTN